MSSKTAPTVAATTAGAYFIRTAETAQVLQPNYASRQCGPQGGPHESLTEGSQGAGYRRALQRNELARL